MPYLNLQSSDGKLFRVKLETLVSSCGSIRTMIEDLGVAGGDEEMIPLPKIRSGVLEKVLDWLERWAEPAGAGAAGWEAEFFSIEVTTLLGLLLAADYLDIQTLFTASCKAVAALIRGKQPDEIRRIFGIKDLDSKDDKSS